MGFVSSQINKELDFRKVNRYFFKTVSELRKINRQVNMRVYLNNGLTIMNYP